MSETFCNLPFSQFDSKANAPCCYSGSMLKRIPEYQKNLPKTFDQMIENDVIKKLQQDLISGVKSDICKVCWHYESIGSSSMRQQNTHITEQKQNVMQSLILDTGNVCNLSCRTCHAVHSSSWIKEDVAFKKEHNIQIGAAHTIRYTDVDNLQNQDFSNLINIEVLGGEPLKNLEHVKVLEAVVKQGYSKNCSISYTTNATQKIPPAIKNILKEFKAVSMTLSIDMIGDAFTYIRTDGQWKDVVSFIKEAKEEGYKLNVHPTISVLNVFYLNNLYTWLKCNNLSWQFNVAESPACYGFGIFTDQERQALIAHLKTSKFDHSVLISHIESLQFNASARDLFWKKCDFTEKYKGYPINQYLPKLIDFLTT